MTFGTFSPWYSLSNLSTLPPQVPSLTPSPGPDESAGARVTSFSDYTACLDYFQSRGYNEVDTARMYVGGKQEAWTRDANWKSRGLTLATKVYPYEAGVHKADRLKEHANISFTELGADCVDIFYLHAPDHSVPFEETLQAVNDMHKEGKFVQLGLSNFAAWEVAEVWNICNERGWVKPTIYQAMYNAISMSTICHADTEAFRNSGLRS
jgi:aflatoxin B1 aldehyde reductase